MALNVWTLLGQLGFDTSDFQKGLKDAEKQVKKTAGILEDDLTEAAAGASTELDNTAKSAKDVNKALAGDEVKERAKQVKTLASEHKAGIKPLEEVKKGLEEQEKALKETALAQDRNSKEYRETVRALAEVRRELDSTNKSLEKQAFDFEKLGGQLTKFGGALSLGVTAPLTALAGVGVASAMQLETFATSLNVLIGEAEAANQVFEELYEFSAVVPFDWRALTEGTRTLAAFGIEADAIVDTLSMLGDVAAGTQSRIEDMAEIYGRVQVTGRASMQEINRLAQRGVPVYTELANILGVTAAEVRELVSAGMIGFPEIEQLFHNLTSAGGKFHGMMEAVSSTTQGRLNTLRDTFEQVTDLIGEALLPTVNRLIGAAQAATDWFINLDEGAQGFAIALGMVLAGTGPLLLALGGIVARAPAILAFFNALRLALIPLGGPAGLITVLVVAVGALALAFSGGDKSLDKALNKVNEALAGNDKDSITSALDDVITKVDGPVRTIFEELRQELVETGDVGVEQMQRISRAAEMAARLMAAQRRVQEAEARLATARTMEETFRTTGAARDTEGGLVFDTARQREQLNNALAGAMEAAVIPLIELGADNQFRFTDRLLAEQAALNIDLVERLMREMSGPIQEIAAVIEESGLSAEAQENLTAAQADLAEILRYINEGDQSTGTPAPGRVTPPPTTTTGGKEKAERTVADIEADLERNIREALRRASFEGTTEAIVAAARAQVAAANAAISELLTDQYEGLIPDGLLDDIRNKRTSAQEIIDRGGLGPMFNQWGDYLNDETERQLARLRAGRTRPPKEEIDQAALLQAEIDQAFARNTRNLRGIAAIANIAGAAMGALAGIAEDVDAFKDRLIEIYEDNINATFGDTDEELSRFKRNAKALADTLKDAADEAARMALFTAAQERYGTGATGLAGTSAAARGRRTDTTAAAAIARETLEQEIALYQRGRGSLEAINAAIEALTTITPLSVKEINDLTGNIRALATEAANAAAFDEAPGLYFDPTQFPGVPRPIGAPGVQTQVTPDRSQLPAAQLAAILEEEMKARRAMVDELLGFTTEDGPLAALGAGIANLVANSIPLLGTAIEGFVQGGPIGAAVAVFTELLSRTESFSEIMAALDGILNPIVEALDSLLSALMPIITVAINLVQGALQPLVIIIEKVLAPVITFVAGLIAGIYNAVARAINFALGWLGVRLPLIDLETGRNQEEPGRQKGLLEELQAEREKLIKQINESTSESEIASLNQRLAEVDAEIARLRALGITEDPTETKDPTRPDDRDPWVFTGTSQTIQFAVATPLVEAAQEMLLAATTMRDTFTPAGGEHAISDFTGALAAATPVLERLATEGIRVDVGLLGADANDYTAVGALR